MDKDRYQRIRAILHEAGDRHGPARAAYLDEACGDDAELRAEVERLLQTPAVATDALLVLPGRMALPDALGPYRLERELGRGGMGAVYAAIDTRDHRRVALKVVHPHLAALPRFLDRFEREAHAGQRIDHGNVVRTLAVERFELGPGQTVHALAMEFVDGRDLRELADDLGLVPESLLREIARQVAAGLAAIHAAGIVHRDVKPENILITGDERVRLMDLGVARLDDASVALTHEGQFIGSLHYASPEQCEGREAGPASDLYALGVVLYELATGVNPFRHETPGASIRAHLDRTPAPAAELNEDLSPFFSELLATLLAKEPAGRFPSGRHLAAVLDEGERSRWWTDRERALRARRRALPRVPVRRDTDLVGRMTELAALRAAWLRAREGRGGTVLLEGEAGLGKTRLVDRFLQFIDGEATHALYGSFPPGGGLTGLADAILGKFGHVDLEEALAPYVGGAAALLPAFVALVRHETLPGDGALDGNAVQALCCRLLRQLAAERPTVWVMDDLHFAPGLARDVALALARAAPPHRALLVLTTRPLPDSERARFAAGAGVERVTLGRLADSEVAQLLEEALGEGAAPTPAFVRKAGGVPMFALELARVTDDAAPLPAAIVDMIATRLRAVGKDERAVLDVGAVQGYDFDPDLVAAVLERPAVTVLQDLADLERRHTLVRAEGRGYRFDHHLVQEIVYRELPVRLREEYHTRLARAHPDGDAEFQAVHLLRGSRPEEALAHLDAALDALEARYLHDEALDLMVRALELDLDDRRRVGLLLRKSARHDLLGQRDAQKHAAERAIALAEAVGDKRLRSRAHEALGRYYQHRGGTEEEALAQYRSALFFAIGAEDKALECANSRHIGGVLAHVRRDTEAIQWHERASALARETGDRRDETISKVNLGIAHRHLGHIEHALGLFEEARAACEALGDRRLLSHSLGNLGSAYWLLGRLDEGRRVLERHLANSVEIGDRRAECGANGNLGVVLHDLGLCEDAKRHLERYLRLAQETASKRPEIIAEVNLGSLAGTLGEIDAGRGHCDNALAMAERFKVPHLAGRAVLTLGNLALQAGEPDRAGELFAESRDRLRAARDRDGEWRALAGLGRLALARGHRAKAATLLRDALAIVKELALPAAELTTRAFLAEATGAPADADAVAHLLGELGDRVGRRYRMEAAFQLWRVRGDREALAGAHRDLGFLRDHAPAAFRDTLIAHVPLHRGIAEAFATRGA